jgi:hypothetical protein
MIFNTDQSSQFANAAFTDGFKRSERPSFQPVALTAQE